MATTTQIFALPTAVLGAGKHGPFVSPQVGASYTSYEFGITQGPSWPTAAGFSLGILIEYSQDGGATWRTDCEIEVGPAPWFGKDRVTPVNIASLKVSMGTLLPGQSGEVIVATGTTDKFRITLTASQACGSPMFTLSGAP